MKTNALILLFPKESFQLPLEEGLPKGYYVRKYRNGDREKYNRLLEEEGWKLSEE